MQGSIVYYTAYVLRKTVSANCDSSRCGTNRVATMSEKLQDTPASCADKGLWHHQPFLRPASNRDLPQSRHDHDRAQKVRNPTPGWLRRALQGRAAQFDEFRALQAHRRRSARDRGSNRRQLSRSLCSSVRHSPSSRVGESMQILRRL